MKKAWKLAILLSLLMGFAYAEDAPEWAQHEFAAPADQVFAAALHSIQVQKHEVKATDELRTQSRST